MQLSDQRIIVSAQRRHSLGHFEDVEKVHHFQLIDTVIEYVQLLTSIIEIFLKLARRAIEQQPRLALREAAELLIQTLPLEA
jgi:hypothetical protein